MNDGPAWTRDQLALLADGRLTGDARVVGLLLSHAGEQGLSYAELEELLPDASRDRLRTAVQKLERCKWADRLIGGKGHSDRFIYIACPPDVTYKENRLADLGILIYRMPASSTLKALSVPASPTLTARSSCNYDVVGVDGERAREDAPADRLDQAALAVLDEPGPKGTPLLAGCRGALLDYLQARVPIQRQHAYVRTVQTWLAGGSGTPRGLLKLSDPTHLVAAALNELGTENELTFKTARGQIGLVATLRVKIERLIEQANPPPKPNGTTPSASAAAVRTRQNFPKPEVSRAS